MKNLLMSTAIVAATALPVMAQDADGNFRTEADPQEVYASEFIGMRVYRAEGVDANEYAGVQDNWDDVGEIHDVILTRDGEVAGVLVDIGGFLGIGENRIALDMDAVRFVSDSATEDSDDDFFLVVDLPRNAFEEAPTYERNALSGYINRDRTAADTTADPAMAKDTDPAMATDKDAMATTETPAPMTEREPIMREGYTVAEPTDLTAEALTGANVYDANDEDIGEISELILNDDGSVKSVVIDVGGFLGMGEKPVELQLSDIDILRETDGDDLRVHVSATKEQLEQMPDYEG